MIFSECPGSDAIIFFSLNVFGSTQSSFFDVQKPGLSEELSVIKLQVIAIRTDEIGVLGRRIMLIFFTANFRK